VAFALVRVGDLLGVDIGPRDKMGRRPELAGVQENRVELGEHGVVQR